MTTLELRPRSSTEIIDAAFQLIRTNYGALLTLSVAAHIPLLIVRLLFFRVPLGTSATPEEVVKMFGSVDMMTWVVGGILVVVLSLGAQSAVIAGTGQAYLAGTVEAGGAVRRAVTRLLTMIIAFVLLMLLFGAAGLALAVVIPLLAAASAAASGIAALIIACFVMYVAIRFAPFMDVLVLEDIGPLEAITRTWALAAGRVGHIFVTGLLALFIYMGVFVVWLALLLAVASVVPATKDPNVTDVLSTVGSAAVFPLLIAVTVVLYYDLRIRHEGFDVEQLARQLEG